MYKAKINFIAELSLLVKACHGLFHSPNSVSSTNVRSISVEKQEGDRETLANLPLRKNKNQLLTGHRSRAITIKTVTLRL
jgi:hypothetical protein